MKTRLTVLSLAAYFVMSPAFAQGPKPKSKGEYDAIMAIQNAATADARLTAIDDLLTKFADTEYKNMVLDMAVETAQQKNDATLVGVWADRALQANPKDFVAMLAIAGSTASGIKEFDLNLKDEVAKVDKNANGALDALKDAPKIQPQMTDAQWADAKKDFASEAYQALAIAAMNQKKYADAVTQFKTAIDTAAHPDPATYVRLGSAYETTKAYDQAIAAFDKAIAVPDASAQIKQIAENLKAEVTKRKAAAAGGTGGTGPAAPKP